jgi:hypothetical protein
MDWGAFIGPAVVAAVVSGIISVIGMVVSTRTALALHTEALKSDERLAQRKFEVDEEVAERKANADIALAEITVTCSPAARTPDDVIRIGRLIDLARAEPGEVASRTVHTGMIICGLWNLSAWTQYRFIGRLEAGRSALSREWLNSGKIKMKNLIPRHINEVESDRRAVKDGWYATNETGKLRCGPFSTLSDCEEFISSKNAEI